MCQVYYLWREKKIFGKKVANSYTEMETFMKRPKTFQIDNEQNIVFVWFGKRKCCQKDAKKRVIYKSQKDMNWKTIPNIFWIVGKVESISNGWKKMKVFNF